MSVSDVDRFRKEAEEARRQAERAISFKLAQDAEKRRAQD